jgi:hypothetical protein
VKSQIEKFKAEHLLHFQLDPALKKEILSANIEELRAIIY